MGTRSYFCRGQISFSGTLCRVWHIYICYIHTKWTCFLKPSSNLGWGPQDTQERWENLCTLSFVNYLYFILLFFLVDLRQEHCCEAHVTRVRKWWMISLIKFVFIITVKAWVLACKNIHTSLKFIKVRVIWPELFEPI